MTALKPGEPGFVYLNRDDVWPDFTLHGLEIVNGELRLESWPGLISPVTINDPALLQPGQPAGIAAGGDGAIFVTDGAHPVVSRVDPCTGEITTISLADVAGGDEHSGFGGLAIDRARALLVVCDPEFGRLLVLDLASFEIVAIWGGFTYPVDCAADPSGNVYVVDRGARRIERVAPGGHLDRSFGDQLAAELAAAALDLIDPVNIAIAPDGTVVVLDRGAYRVIFAGADDGLDCWFELAFAGDALGLAVTDRMLLVGENDASGRVHSLRPNGESLGVCAGYSGPVAGLAIGSGGALLLNPGWLAGPLQFNPHGTTNQLGCAVGGPFGGFAGWNKRWHQLSATIAALPATTHVTFAVQTTDTPVAPSISDPPDLFGGYILPAHWQLGPIDLERWLIRLPERRYAWVGIQFESEGKATPSVEQVRLDFDLPGYLKHLPEIYREEAGHDALLARYLALVATMFDDVETGIDAMPAALDPAGTSRLWLEKLARWLGLDRSPFWSEAELRDAVAEAWAESARRGTVAGLSSAIDRYSGIGHVIEEPIVQANWWSLATPGHPVAEQELSLLGVSTVLVAAEPAGAVLGQTATIGRSHLIPGDQFGAPLFESLAHRVLVRVSADESPERLANLDALIEREKPAHVLHQLCAVRPGTAAGELRIGIDATLGGEPPPARFDGAARAGMETVLAGEAALVLGSETSLGNSTRLRG